MLQLLFTHFFRTVCPMTCGDWRSIILWCVIPFKHDTILHHVKVRCFLLCDCVTASPSYDLRHEASLESNSAKKHKFSNFIFWMLHPEILLCETNIISYRRKWWLKYISTLQGGAHRSRVSSCVTRVFGQCWGKYVHAYGMVNSIHFLLDDQTRWEDNFYKVDHSPPCKNYPLI